MIFGLNTKLHTSFEEAVEQTTEPWLIRVSAFWPRSTSKPRSSRSRRNQWLW